MRPKKTRWIACSPKERCFRPRCVPEEKLEGVYLTLDELEAVRLVNLAGLTQEEAAERMGVHRSTISRILKAANRKIADALVNVKAIKIEGGCCEYAGEGNQS